MRAAPERGAVAEPAPVLEAQPVDGSITATFGPCGRGVDRPDNEPPLCRIPPALVQGVLPHADHTASLRSGLGRRRPAGFLAGSVHLPRLFSRQPAPSISDGSRQRRPSSRGGSKSSPSANE